MDERREVSEFPSRTTLVKPISRLAWALKTTKLAYIDQIRFTRPYTSIENVISPRKSSEMPLQKRAKGENRESPRQSTQTKPQRVRSALCIHLDGGSSLGSLLLHTGRLHHDGATGNLGGDLGEVQLLSSKSSVHCEYEISERERGSVTRAESKSTESGVRMGFPEIFLLLFVRFLFVWMLNRTGHLPLSSPLSPG